MSAPKRIQRKRTKGWRMPEGAVYVGRGTRWGNPYTFADMKDVHPRDDISEIRRKVVSDYRGWVEGKWTFGGDDLDNGAPFDVDTSPLRGHDLACWCPLDQPCHADVLLEIANGDAS